MTNTSDLFQPTSLDVPGNELDVTITALEARGAIVQRMDVVSISGYRLGIVWLDSEKERRRDPSKITPPQTLALPPTP